MSDYKVTDTELISVANAIRTKGGTQAQLEWPSGFVSAIGSIQSGGAGGDYYRVRYYNNSGSLLYNIEYYPINTHPTKSGNWTDQINGTTPINLNTINTSIDLYIINPDNYVESNDGTLGVLHFSNYDVWFFNRYSKGASDVTIPSELLQYTIPNGIYQAKAYNDIDSSNWVGNIGFYNTNNIRSWSLNNASVVDVNKIFAVVEIPIQSGTTTVDIGGANCQYTEYLTPVEYLQSHINN